LHPKLRLPVLAITLTRVVINTSFRFVYPFLGAFGRGLGVDLGSLSLALSARSFAGALGPLFASVADTRGRKFGMLFGLALFIGGLTAVIVWQSYLALIITLLLTAFGKSIFDPSVQAFLGDQIPYEQRGRAIGLSEFGWSISFIVGVPLMGFLIVRGGWVAPFPALGIMGLFCFLGLARLIPRDPGRDHSRPGMGANFRKIFTSTPALLALFAGLCLSGANEMVNLIFGVWMEASFSVQITALGAASLVIGLAELLGEGLVSGFTDRLGKIRAVVGGILLNCLAALALPLLSTNLSVAMVGLFLFYLTFEFSLVSFIPFMSEVVPSARATFMSTTAASVMLGRALTALLASQVFESGILASAIAAISINLIAVLALLIYRRLVSD
jgi:predicted MFS family arabinose efflux permease